MGIANNALVKILEFEVKYTKPFVGFLLGYPGLRFLRRNSQYIEISCHEMTWLAGWLLFCWISCHDASLYEMRIKMLFGLILDFVIVAVLKARTKRDRPRVHYDTFSIGPNKFSFPSGHASRAFFIVGFFTILHPLPILLFLAIIVWAFGVAVSQLLMYRHHLLDVCAGILLGFMETLILYLFWHDPEFTKFIKYTTEDFVPHEAEK